jgi:hypothetical protein
MNTIKNTDANAATDANALADTNNNNNESNFINKIHEDKNDKPCHSFVINNNNEQLSMLINKKDNYFYEITCKYDLRYLWCYCEENRIAIWTKYDDTEYDERSLKCQQIEDEILEKMKTFVPDHKEVISLDDDELRQLISVGGKFFKNTLQNIDNQNIKKIYYEPGEKSICIFLDKQLIEEDKNALIQTILRLIYTKIYKISQNYAIPDHKEKINFNNGIICRLISKGGTFLKYNLKQIDDNNIYHINFNQPTQSINIFLNKQLDIIDKEKLIKKLRLAIYVKIHDIICYDFNEKKIKKDDDLYKWAKNLKKYYNSVKAGNKEDDIPVIQYSNTINKEKNGETNDETNNTTQLINNENSKFIE